MAKSPPNQPHSSEEKINRREALAKGGRFAAYTAPVMISVLLARKASAYRLPQPTPKN
ncbi:MAG: hypothetical protein KQJ78_03720 [Deltaproteobacteria bacterium]|nr:hypothetical protein [Deltaproteobacteria bacterium]